MLKIERVILITALAKNKAQIKTLAYQIDPRDLTFIVDDLFDYPYHTNPLHASGALVIVDHLKEYVGKKPLSELASKSNLVDVVIASLFKLIEHCIQNTKEAEKMKEVIKTISKLYDRLSRIRLTDTELK